MNHIRFESDTSSMIYPAEDVPGQWIAHCLDFGVVTQGNDPVHAAYMLLDALTLVLSDDVLSGKNPHRRRASAEEWAEFEALKKKATRRAPLDNFRKAKRGRFVMHTTVRVGGESS